MRPVRRSAPLALTFAILLFLVLVGSALAVGSRQGGQAATKLVPQQRCANGAVKAIVLVVADQNRGFQKAYVRDPSFFKTRWSCKAGAVFQARRFDRGVYDVRIGGLSGSTPLVTPIGAPVKVGISALPDGGFRVQLIGVDAGGKDYAVDESFVLVLL